MEEKKTCHEKQVCEKSVLVEAINKLKIENNAVILAHYYQNDEIQDIADFVGDSLALAQWAAKSDASVLVICGVHFMAETAKILCPSKKVLIPDDTAGCSLAESCPTTEFEKFVKEHPDHTVISYVNTSAEIKALTDVVVTSSNAKQIVESFSKDTKIIFGPDRNLGSYINCITNRNMLLWNGACNVHEQFTVEKIEELKKLYPNALVLAHPECKEEILQISDVVGSTAKLLKCVIESDTQQFIVATESGILHKMRLAAPNKQLIPVPSMEGEKCIQCHPMRLNTLQKLYDCLKDEKPEIVVDRTIAEKAVKSIQKMLEISAQLGL